MEIATHPWTHTCSKKFGQILLEGMGDVMGDGGVQLVLEKINGMNKDYLHSDNLEFTYHNISSIQASLEEIYGLQSGRGLAQRCGRSAFKYSLRAFGEQAGMITSNFRLLPVHKKVLVGAQLLSQEICKNSDQQMHIEEDAVSYRWVIEQCPICRGRHAEQPTCYLALGYIQEFLSWAGGGKYYPVSEVECAAMGDPACVFLIAKQALE